MSFFNKNFTKEDLLLYILTIGILVYLGWYFQNSQEQLMKAIDYKINNVKTEEIALLEASKMRYEFVGKVLMSNSTRNNLSFLIGSIMCLLGALIIIRKARTDAITASGGDKNFSFSIVTTSPGIFLAFLGTLVLIFSISIKDKYNVTENDSITEIPDYYEQSKTSNGDEPDGDEAVWDQ